MAKAISQVRPEVIVPRAADPAVLVDLHSDLRLSLHRLVAETGVELAETYAVTAVATGCVDLAPVGVSAEESPQGHGLSVRVDGRGRMRLSKGLVHRLAVRVGEKVLVSVSPHSGEVRLLNLSTLADAVEAHLRQLGVEVPSGDATGGRRGEGSVV